MAVAASTFSACGKDAFRYLNVHRFSSVSASSVFDLNVNGSGGGRSIINLRLKDVALLRMLIVVRIATKFTVLVVIMMLVAEALICITTGQCRQACRQNCCVSSCQRTLGFGWNIDLAGAFKAMVSKMTEEAAMDLLRNGIFYPSKLWLLLTLMRVINWCCFAPEHLTSDVHAHYLAPVTGLGEDLFSSIHI